MVSLTAMQVNITASLPTIRMPPVRKYDEYPGYRCQQIGLHQALVLLSHYAMVKNIEIPPQFDAKIDSLIEALAAPAGSLPVVNKEGVMVAEIDRKIVMQLTKTGI